MQFEMFGELCKGGIMYGVLYYFGVASGLRIGDILGVRVRDIQIDMKVLESKTCKFKEFRLDDQVYELIRNYISVKELDYADRLFPVTRQTVLRHFRRAAEALGLKDIGTHSMRKTYA